MLDVCDKKKIINNADLFSQPCLIIFTKRTNNSNHDCRYLETCEQTNKKFRAEHN